MLFMLFLTVLMFHCINSINNITSMNNNKYNHDNNHRKDHSNDRAVLNISNNYIYHHSPLDNQTTVTSSSASSSSSSLHKIAIIITLQGNKNLKEYFRWSCLSIGGSSPLVDMLVFHENNPKVHALKCAKNVIFINLNKNGLSKLLVDFLLPSHDFKEIRSSLYSVVSDIFNFSPRYYYLFYLFSSIII